MFAVPPLNPDVAVVHAQRADAAGNTQVWGLTATRRRRRSRPARVIVVVEELVLEEVVRPTSPTLIPGIKVDAVVVCSCSAPTPPTPRATTTATTASTWSGTGSAATPRRSRGGWTEGFLGTATHEEYVDKLGAERWPS